MSIDEETLMAYADGELDEAGAFRVRSALEADPALAARVEEFRAMRSTLVSQYDPVLDEAVPDHLTALLDGNASAEADPVSHNVESPSAEIIAFSSIVRQPVTVLRQTSWGNAGALAASLLVGVFFGGQFLSPQANGYFDSAPGGLVAAGQLASTLDTARSGASDGPIQVVMSFQSTEGATCRAFVLDNTGGLACREGGSWAVRTTEQLPALATGEIRTASTTLPAALLERIDALMADDILSLEDEQIRIDAGWDRSE